MTQRDQTPDEIWAVYTGPYYEKDVLCVCPTKDDAERIANRYSAERSDGEVEVHPLTFMTADTPKISTLRMTTQLWDDGTETNTAEHVYTNWPYEATDDDRVAVKALWVRARFMIGHGRLDVFGTDHDRVREMYRERRAQLLANEELRKTPWDVFRKDPWS